MNNVIVIVSVEGKESYTEVNFFSGIINHKHDLEMKVLAISKSSKTKTKEKNNHKLRTCLYPLFRKNQNKNFIFFFIGDGEKNEDIRSMERAQDESIELIEAMKPSGCTVEFNKNIFPKGKKFEEELDYVFATKSKSYFNGFNDFSNAKGFFIESDFSWKKAMEYFEGTIYSKIFFEVINYE